MKTNRLLLAVPLLLGTTALVDGADPAQTIYPVDDAHGFFSLSGTVGGVVMDLPDGGGLFLGEGADDANDLLFGGTVGVSAAVGTGRYSAACRASSGSTCSAPTPMPTSTRPAPSPARASSSCRVARDRSCRPSR